MGMQRQTLLVANAKLASSNLDLVCVAHIEKESFTERKKKPVFH